MSDTLLLLDYHDACIYRSDIALLENNTAWLNDACINFQMTRINMMLRKGSSQVSPSSSGSVLSSSLPKLLCLDPSVVSFFMHQLSMQDEDDVDEMKNLCLSWGLSSSSSKNNEEDSETETKIILLLIPINDNHGGSKKSFRTVGGGNHWSLLVCCYIPNNNFVGRTGSSSSSSSNDSGDDDWYFFHLDSSSGCNANAAVSVANKIRTMNLLLANHNNSNNNNNNNSNAHNEDIKVIECKTPQQINGYDCGVCTLCATQAIHDEYSKSTNWKDDQLFRDKSTMKKWLEDTVSEFSNQYNDTNAMSRIMRKAISQDIRSLIVHSG